MSRTLRDVLEEIRYLEHCIEAAEGILEYVDKTAQNAQEEKREAFASICEHLLSYVDVKNAYLEKLMKLPFGGNDEKEKKKSVDSSKQNTKKSKIGTKSRKKDTQS